MRILLTGSSGLIGRHLQPILRAAGHEVVRLLRSAPANPEEDAVHFDLASPDVGRLEGFDAVIHLAGENIARRWTARRKASILASRGLFTQRLCTALAQTRKPPAHVLSASATGYYGHHRTEPLTEEASTGDGFLAEVCRQWEAGTGPLAAAHPPPRVAILRLGVVLTPDGGALGKMLPAFRFGLGGVIGGGEQVLSWISLPDVLAAILHVLERPGLAGPINLTSPNPVTNRQFTKTLARVLHRPAILPVPAAALRLAFGQMADETLLASQSVVPAKLLASGFAFRHPDLTNSLQDLLAAQ